MSEHGHDAHDSHESHDSKHESWLAKSFRALAFASIVVGAGPFALATASVLIPQYMVQTAALAASFSLYKSYTKDEKGGDHKKDAHGGGHGADHGHGH